MKKISKNKSKVVRQTVRLYLSPHIIAFFKSKGRNWQTRIDRALSAFVEAAE